MFNWLFYLLFVAVTVHAACSDIKNRLDCGYSDISEDFCQARGCCYEKKSGSPSCYFDGEGTQVKRVHVIMSNHFDAGYADLTVNVVNKYFTEYFPRAATIGDKLRAANVTDRLAWMTQSWLISLYLDCPSGLGLHCPKDSDVITFKKAVANGDITWHAFPHNSQLSLSSPEMIIDLIAQTHALDATLSSPFGPKKTLSQRDVVGLPRPLIPALQKSGVNTISVGSNGRCLPPNVPNAFRWRDASQHSVPSTLDRHGIASPSGEDMFVIWHAYGYGQLGGDDQMGDDASRDYLQLPGHSEALVYAWRGDNQGPPTSVKEVTQDLQKAASFFPGTPEVITSTFDDFVATIPLSVIQGLPLIDEDLEDSWVQGAAQAPELMTGHRALQRAHSACVASKKCVLGDSIVHNFTRFLSKNAEHTFGLSIFHYGHWEKSGYDNSVFHKALKKDDKNLQLLAKSWDENLQWGLDAARNAVPKTHALTSFIDSEMKKLPKPIRPDPSAQGFQKVDDPTQILALAGWLDIGFDTHGAIILLQDTRQDNINWADATHPLALLRYQTLTDDDFLSFRKAYLRPGSGGEIEYGKPNVTCCSQLATPTLVNTWAKNSSHNASILAQMVFNESLNTDYGAPQELWLRIEIPDQQSGEITMVVTILNKTATRWPESMYVTMNPKPDSKKSDGKWLMDKMNEWVSPNDVADGASKGVHGISSGVTFIKSNGKNIFFGTPDTALIRWGNPMPTPMPLIGALNFSAGGSFPLFANVFWNTNYPFWMPFEHGLLQKDYAWRFSMDLGKPSGN